MDDRAGGILYSRVEKIYELRKDEFLTVREEMKNATEIQT
jgi:hypothetical protein